MNLAKSEIVHLGNVTNVDGLASTLGVKGMKYLVPSP